jgi:hypothetical protein
MSDEKSGHKTHFNFICGGIAMIVAFGFLIFAICLPNFVGKERNPALPCISNLKAIDGSKATWALEYDKQTNEVPTDTDLFGADKYMREKPVCPAGGIYAIGSVGENPRCSIPGHTI